MMIRTARLLLRPTFPEDWREVFRGISGNGADAGIVRMLARAPWPYLAEHAQEYCQRPFDPLALKFAITLPEESGCPVIGQIGIENHSDGVEYEIGYWIARECWGRGYAGEAAEAVLDAASILGIAQVEGGHFHDNAASGAVLRKCGFVATGETRETASSGRGGAMVPALRYTCDLTRRPVGQMMARAA